MKKANDTLVEELAGSTRSLRAELELRERQRWTQREVLPGSRPWAGARLVWCPWPGSGWGQEQGNGELASALAPPGGKAPGLPPHHVPHSAWPR